NEALKRVLDYLATDLIENTRSKVEASGAKSVEDIRSQNARLAAFSPDAARAAERLKGFLNEHLYSNPAIAEERERSVEALDELFSLYLENPARMPASYAARAKREPVHRVACDYIAGMTDQFLLRQHGELIGASAHGKN
ncbi:MAG: deoxyguanosinetriphosphate triphosphohydrolase, partial [Acidobacteriota bacterium]|nr:deoxyguanosinetriphosphate triphosphohydrolase [Acidobacteriota bacterium]